MTVTYVFAGNFHDNGSISLQQKIATIENDYRGTCWICAFDQNACCSRNYRHQLFDTSILICKCHFQEGVP